MNDRIHNRLTMIGASITLAERPENAALWQTTPPTAFGTDLAALKSARQATLDIATQAASATGGAADDKDTAETALETAAFTLARAAANHFKKTGDLTRRAKVDFTKNAIQKLRDQDLIATSRDILATATGAKDEPDAASRGITAAALTALDTAIGDFEKLVNHPRSGIVNRAALNREIETRVAGLMEDIADLDDLVLQFTGTAAADHFRAAWKQARIILDSGHGPGKEEPPAPPVPPQG